MSSQERIILVGGGGFARELLYFAHDCHKAGMLPVVHGFIEDGSGEELAKLGYDLPWLGTTTDFTPAPGDLLLLGIGGPEAKRRVVARLKEKGCRFTRLIHPTAVASGRIGMGEGVVLCPFTGGGTDTTIGDFVAINSYTGLGHDARIGDFTTLSSHVDIMGGVQVGSDVLVGSSASILPKVKIGAGARIGAGATVYRSVPAAATVYQPPAKLLKK